MCANKRKICKKTILKYSFGIIYQKVDFPSEYFYIPFMLVCNWKYIIWPSEKDSCRLTVYIVANEPERERERERENGQKGFFFFFLVGNGKCVSFVGNRFDCF